MSDERGRPIKDQINSYRIRNGERYSCHCDCLNEDCDRESMDVIKDLRQRGIKAFRIRMDGGNFYRIFAREEMMGNEISGD